MYDIGYSGTPLVKKLGLQNKQQVLLIELPSALQSLASACDFQSVEYQWPEATTRTFESILWFGKDREILEQDAPRLFNAIIPNGFIWICWPKKASGMPTTISGDVARQVLLPTGLVDVKVCAVDDVWSGLKFTIRKEHRAALSAYS